MRRRLKSLVLFLLGFVLGSAVSVGFAEAVRAEPQAQPGYDMPPPEAGTASG
jgi:hypothetical protein